MNIISLLESNKNLDYQAFMQKICFTKYPIVGVKIPTVKKLAKDLLKENDFKEILSKISDATFEEVLLEAFIISYAKVSFEEKINLIKNFLPKIDNWAICDSFISSLKFIKDYQEETLIFLKELLKYSDEYYLRFVIVTLLNYYVNDSYYNEVLNILINIKSEYYYVKMALAWAYSILLTKYFEEAINFLTINKNNIDKWTYNKALQKGRESFKLSKEQKERLKQNKMV